MKGTFISNRFGGQGSLSLEFRRKVTGFAKPISRSRSKRTHTHKKKNVPKFYRFFVIFFLNLCLEISLLPPFARNQGRKRKKKHTTWKRESLELISPFISVFLFLLLMLSSGSFFKGGGQVLLSVGVYQVHHM